MSRVVIIKWVDAKTLDPWTQVKDLVKEKPAMCQTVGWLLYRDRERTIVASSVNGENGGEACATIVIPTACIIGPIKTLGTSKSLKD